MEKLYIWVRKYRLHLLIWAIYITYEISITMLAFGIYGKPLNYMVHYSIIICLFYTHAKLGMPFALQSKNAVFWKLPLVFLLESTVFLLLTFGVDLILVKWNYASGPVVLNGVYMLKNAYRGIFFMGFSSGYYLLLTYNLEKRRSEERERQRLGEVIVRQRAEQELAGAQNAFLKAQINPHFLFNTLDFIYHKVGSHSPEAADAVITLAEMMRFAIDADKMGEFILLGDELEQVLNLLTLNNLRKGEDAPFRLTYEDGIEELRFIPLILLTLTENIFKHGDMSAGRPASLDLRIRDNALEICSQNVSGRAVAARSHHTGLANLEKRIRFSYGEEASIHCTNEAEGLFKVLVKVPLSLLAPASANTGTEWLHAVAAPGQRSG